MASLIAYFSRAGENYFSGAIKNIEVGNTQRAAAMLQELTGADLYAMAPVQPYSKKYDTCIEEAKNDQKRGARPELKYYPEDMAKYDTIYLGYPNYWGTMPMAVFTFLEHWDFSGKTICPFCTHEGSGMGRSEADIRKLCPNAVVKPGLAIFGSRVKEAGPAFEAWLKTCKKD